MGNKIVVRMDLILNRALKEMDECVPKFCPNCGAPLVRVSGTKIWVMPLGEKKDRVDTFDVYCNECEWSGNISPDSLDLYYDMKKAEGAQ